MFVCFSGLLTLHHLLLLLLLLQSELHVWSEGKRLKPPATKKPPAGSDCLPRVSEGESCIFRNTDLLAIMNRLCVCVCVCVCVDSEHHVSSCLSELQLSTESASVSILETLCLFHQPPVKNVAFLHLVHLCDDCWLICEFVHLELPVDSSFNYRNNDNINKTFI